MKTGPLFIKLRECQKKIRVLQGGGDAGKTITALQDMAVDLVYNKSWIGTVNAQTVPHLKAGALRSFEDYVLPDFKRYIKGYNASERTFTFRSNSIMEFKSFQDELGARGAERHLLFMNECNSEPYANFWQLQRKTRKKITLDYNPTSPFWVHSQLLQGGAKEFTGKVQLYIIDHRHNPFLTAEDHESYELISDPEMFRVYARGQTGRIRGLIYGHFKKWNDAWPEDAMRTIWGIDYGYTNDPTALVKIAVGGPTPATVRRRVARELTYEAGLSAESLKHIIDLNGIKETDIIYSEADPNMINQLRILGLPVYPAIKGPGSVAAGISKTKEHDCYYTKDSLNFEKEIMNYKWLTAQDVVTGKEVMTNVPVDQWNHLCDAFRMADYTDSFRYR